jgi:hypothetical protein
MLNKIIKMTISINRCRGCVMWVCPSGTHGLVYRIRPVMEVDKYKDSKIDLEIKKKGSNTYSTRTLVKP